MLNPPLAGWSLAASYGFRWGKVGIGLIVPPSGISRVSSEWMYFILPVGSGSSGRDERIGVGRGGYLDGRQSARFAGEMRLGETAQAVGGARAKKSFHVT